MVQILSRGSTLEIPRRDSPPAKNGAATAVRPRPRREIKIRIHSSLLGGGTGAKVSSKEASWLSMYDPAALLMASESCEYIWVVSLCQLLSTCWQKRTCDLSLSLSSHHTLSQGRTGEAYRVDNRNSLVDHHGRGARTTGALAEAFQIRAN